MKIAIATISKEQDSPVSYRAGKAPYFLIFNEKKELLETVSNPFLVEGGTGVAVVKMLESKKIDIFIAGVVGENMREALKESGIEYRQQEGTADKVLKNII